MVHHLINIQFSPQSFKEEKKSVGLLCDIRNCGQHQQQLPPVASSNNNNNDKILAKMKIQKGPDRVPLRKERPFFQYTGHVVVEHSSLLVVITFSSFVLSSFSSFTCARRRKKKESLAQPLGFSHLAPPSTGQFHLKYHGSVVSCRRHFLLLQLFFLEMKNKVAR